MNSSILVDKTVMETMVDLVCERPGCGKKFVRRAAEHRRNMVKGRKVLCSRSCSVSNTHITSPRRGNPKTLRCGCSRDEFSPFRWFIRRADARKQYGSYNITPEYLKQLWEQQGDRCPFTGWSLVLPETTAGWSETSDARRASLDRIDNSRGYMQGNVRFVSVMFNLARNDFSDEQVVQFCAAVTRNRT